MYHYADYKTSNINSIIEYFHSLSFRCFCDWKKKHSFVYFCNCKRKISQELNLSCILNLLYDWGKLLRLRSFRLIGFCEKAVEVTNCFWSLVLSSLAVQCSAVQCSAVQFANGTALLIIVLYISLQRIQHGLFQFR